MVGESGNDDYGKGNRRRWKIIGSAGNANCRGFAKERKAERKAMRCCLIDINPPVLALCDDERLKSRWKS